VLLFDNEPLSFLNRERISTPLFVRNGRTEKVTLGKYPDVSLRLARLKRDDVQAH